MAKQAIQRIDFPEIGWIPRRKDAEGQDGETHYKETFFMESFVFSLFIPRIFL